MNSNIDFAKIWPALLSKKKLFFKVWGITFILSCIWILPQPRYYTTEVSVAPESAEAKDMGNLASLASNFGVNIGNGSSDAIYPQLYPDLFESTKFLVGLLDIKVRTQDGEVETDYYTYMKDYQKQNILLWPFLPLKRWLSSVFSKPEEEIPGKDGKRFDPFELSWTTNGIIKKIQDNVQCTYSRTTDVVTIEVTDQDPLVCALLADSIKQHLQDFVTEYRTKKSRIDLEYYEKLTAEAKAMYDKSRLKYAAFSDASTNVSLRSVELKMQDMENDMQAKYNIYTAMSTRLEAAAAKVQESTPAFTELKNATVPIKPAGPKRMIFVAVMLFLATCGTIIHLYRKELKEWF
ncbi:MAG: chain-length determining protein [Prevotella sp.]|nr:chain-length determining protein [Prevotella sp.]